jgi:hypothetical protein
MTAIMVTVVVAVFRSWTAEGPKLASGRISQLPSSFLTKLVMRKSGGEASGGKILDDSLLSEGRRVPTLKTGNEFAQQGDAINEADQVLREIAHRREGRNTSVAAIEAEAAAAAELNWNRTEQTSAGVPANDDGRTSLEEYNREDNENPDE